MDSEWPRPDSSPESLVSSYVPVDSVNWVFITILSFLMSPSEERVVYNGEREQPFHAGQKVGGHGESNFGSNDKEL